MKIYLIITFLTFGVVALAQQEVSLPENQTFEVICRRSIMRIDTSNFDDFTRLQIIKTSDLSIGALPLSKDLPMVQTIHGTVYTFDHIRTQPRN